MLNLLVEGLTIRARLVHSVVSGGIVQSAMGEMQGCAVVDGAVADVIAVMNSGVIYLPSGDTFDTDYQRVYLRTADLIIVGSPLPVLEAPNPSASPQPGGTLSDGDYYYAITVTDGHGESVIGNVASATAGAGNNTVRVSWSLVPGTVEYNVYRGITSTELFYLTAFNDPATQFDDDGSYIIGASSPPSYNSTGTQYIGRYLSGYDGTIEVRSTIKTSPDGSTEKVSANIEQKWVPAGSIPILLKLS